MKKSILLLILIFLVSSCVSISESSISSESNASSSGGVVTSSSDNSVASSSSVEDPIVTSGRYATRSFEDGIEITRYIGNEIEINIPSNIGDKTVIRIGDYAFLNNKSAKVVNIPNTVTSLGSFVFSNSSSLETINLPANLTVIGNEFVKNTSRLKAINVDDANDIYFDISGVLYCYVDMKPVADYRNFQTDTSESSIDTSSEIELIAYPSSLEMTTLTIPEDVSNIGTMAFQGNQTLEEVIIPESVITIGVGAFMNCQNLIKITIPGSISDIPPYMCYGCTSLTDLVLSEGIVLVSSYAFYGCTSLENISLPSTILGLKRFAFANIGPVQTIQIPTTIFEIDGTVFSSNNHLTEFSTTEEGASIIAIDGILYSDWGSKLLAYPTAKPGTTFTIPETVSVIGYGAFDGNMYLEEIVITNSVYIMEDYSFARTQSLKSLYIPAGVSSLSFYTTYWNTSIEEYVVDPGNQTFTSVDGVLYSSDLSTLYFFPPNKDIPSFTIPETTTKVEDIAFLRNRHLETLTITKNLSQIDGGAFAYMQKLTSIDVVDENTYFNDLDGVLYSEDGSILYNVPSGREIETFEIPNTVSELYYGAFEGNPHIRNMIIPETVNRILSYSFQDCTNLEWVVFMNPNIYLGMRLFVNVQNVVVFLSFSSNIIDQPQMSIIWNIDDAPVFYEGEWLLDEEMVPQLILS